MSAALLYALATVAGYVGAVAGIVLIARLVTRAGGLATPAIVAGAGLLFSRIVTGAGKGTAQIPLFWPVMPYTAWLALLAGIILLMRLYGAATALSPEERRTRLVSAWLAGVFVVLMVFLYRGDDTSKITILQGGIPLDPKAIFGLLALAIGATVLMAALARTNAGRDRAKSLAAQGALLVGSFVFGLPFAYLVVTSFKEDRDMSSADGIVWVPKVTETRPYKDPKQPLYEGKFQGQTVEGGVIAKLPDGRVRVDIYRPLAIRGNTFETAPSALKEIPRQAAVVTVSDGGKIVQGLVAEDLDSGDKRVILPDGRERVYPPTEAEPVRHAGLRTANYTEAISFLPPETRSGLVYLANSLFLVIMGVIGTVLSCALVAYAFSRMSFPGKNALFTVLLATMMLPGAVTLMPQFLIFRSLGWVDTLYPLWVPAFFAGAFNVFLLRQFFMQIPMELEDAAKIDGASYAKSFWSVMLPQIKPALAVVAVGTALGAWNNFQGPLIYINSPEKMPLSYALQLFQGDRGGEQGLLMAFTTLTILPPLALFFFAQRYIIEGASLSGLGGR